MRKVGKGYKVAVAQPKSRDQKYSVRTIVNNIVWCTEIFLKLYTLGVHMIKLLLPFSGSFEWRVKKTHTGFKLLKHFKYNLNLWVSIKFKAENLLIFDKPLWKPIICVYKVDHNLSALYSPNICWLKSFSLLSWAKSLHLTVPKLAFSKTIYWIYCEKNKQKHTF